MWPEEIKVTATLVNGTGRAQTGNIVLTAARINAPGTAAIPPLYVRFAAAEGRSETSLNYPSAATPCCGTSSRPTSMP